MASAQRILRYLFDPAIGAANHLLPRWLFLRALGLIYFSAFYALLFQVRGLIGPTGILPAIEFLGMVRKAGAVRYWYAPTLLWLSSTDQALMALCWAGLTASVLLVVNFWPRAMLLVCFLCFLSFVSAAQVFSGYQSDGMLLEAGFLSLFLAPPGIRPGLAARWPAPRAAMFLLLWEWFRIYFESGLVKLESGDPTWRNLTALYEYYQNGPLPTWIGWYLQHLPHWFHIATAAATLVMELFLIWMAFLPRRWRIACFFIVTIWQIVVIATANYAFLNYLVLVLAVLLLDDAFISRFIPARWRPGFDSNTSVDLEPATAMTAARDRSISEPVPSAPAYMRLVTTALVLTWIFYAATVPLALMVSHQLPLPTGALIALEPFRIANQYGLFAVMTPHRYEIEFQGSTDGRSWTAYAFRYKPQSLSERPPIYAPYHPRFDWNLWFASLDSWQQNPMVLKTEERLLENDRDVLKLFAGNPFPDAPPRLVRAVLWQYWFSTPQQKRTQGVWWTRTLLGTYSPTITRFSDGHFGLVEEPSLNGPPPP